MLFRKNVFILGAGFSADAGAPVMSNFLQKARQLLDNRESGLHDEDRKSFKRVFDFLRELRAAQAKITLDLENIEHLFGLAEMDLGFGGGNRGAFRRDLIFLILKTLERSIRAENLGRYGWNIAVKVEDTRQGASIAANYGELFAALAGRRWLGPPYGIPADGCCQDAVVTLNYDCFLDDILVRLGVRPDYGLPDVSYSDEQAKLPFQMPFLKLHGSANWFRCNSEICKGKVRIEEGSPAARLEYFYGPRCQVCSHQIEPIIVPPTWAKSSEQEALAPIWRSALRALREAGRIIIIGYSMPGADAFFQYLLGLALATNEEIDQIIVVNPDEEALLKFQQLFQQHFGERRFVPVKSSAAMYITNMDQQGGLARTLGQFQEGFSREKIEASGFQVR